jgi:N-acyl homoserine lactone hydrolase
MKLFLLSGGTVDVDRAVIFPGDDSHRRVTLPVVQILLQDEGQTILIDTGMPASVAGDSEALKREYDIDPTWIRPVMAPEERIDAQLAALHLRPADLDMVINTHFHFDHAGSNALFGGVPITIQEAEIEAALESDSYGGWWTAPDLQFRTVQGDWSPLPGVEMLHTPGHTPGHQSMLVRFTDQPWLFTWDAVYTEEHWREGKLGAVGDVAAARSSIARLHEIADVENAKVIFGHDVGQWSALGMAHSKPPPWLVAGDEY